VKLKTDIVSDVVCPWGTIGYKQLEKTIKELGVEDQIEIEWQPFQLNPNKPAKGQNLQEHIVEKHGSSPEQYRQMQEQMTAGGDSVDFVFDYYKEQRMANSFDAHV